VKINSGDSFARNTAASLSIQATDPSGVAKMCVSLTSACSSWENFANSKAIVLSKGQGIKTVNVWFEDGRGNRTNAAIKDDIILDSVAPTTGKITGRAQGKSAILTWKQGSDVNGIAAYRLVYKRGNAAPKASCTDGTSIAVAPGALTVTVPNLASKNNYGFRVCAVDYAGNISSGTTVSVRIP
jgi:hypothetical protein